MQRRDFLKVGVQGAAFGAAVSLPADFSRAAENSAVEILPGGDGVPAILKSYSADDHRRRLENIGHCTRGIRKCMRTHLITNYLYGQCCYNLGEYPSREPWAPNDYDEQELDRLKAHGIQLIQVMDEWNDRYGLFGGNKLTAVNPDGFRRFVKMVQQRGIKILAYASTGYFSESDPDYRKEWSRPGDKSDAWWDLARCSPASPAWRAYLLPRMMRILDDYGVDGLYNDWGYVSNFEKTIKAPAQDEVAAFAETPEHDGAVSDLMHLIYAEVKRRGGIYKAHADKSNEPLSGGLKVYDYLWVGECVENAEAMREDVKNHTPYVVPCIQGTFAKIESIDEPFLHSIPYMQFPLLLAGRPLTGERGVIPIPRLPGVHEGGFYEKAWEYYQKHPEGPYVYGGWDALPPSAETRLAHARWLKQYAPLAEDGTWAWLEIGDSDLLIAPLPRGVVASAFANRELYLVLANYGKTAAEVATSDAFVATTEPGTAARKQWRIEPRSLQILRRAVVG
jgi:hypothetical protein